MRFVCSSQGFVSLSAVLVALFFASSSAWALRPTNENGRFQQHVQTRQGGAIAVAPRALDRLDQSDKLRVDWEEFRSRQGGRWQVYLDERTAMPTLVSGSGIEWFPEEALTSLTRDGVEARARAFLEENSKLLGQWNEILELDTEASADLGGDRWLIVFRQVVSGVPVENARLEFHVNNGRLTMFGASHWSVPRVSGVPAIDVVEARKALDLYLGESTADHDEAEAPKLVLMALDAAPAGERPTRWAGLRGQGLTHALVWRLQFHDPEGPELWVGEIDAHDGSIRAFYDGAHYTSIRGGVFPQHPDGDCPAGGCEIDEFPMPFADWSENGQPAEFADEFGNLTCNDPATTVTTSLRGPYVHVWDDCGPVAETASCGGEGVQLGLKPGENCDVGPHTSPGNTAASRSGYYHVNRVAEVARFYNPTNAWLQTPVKLITNWPQTCNASWGNGSIYMYRSGNGCANGAEVQGVVVHEWGHGYDQFDGGGFDNTSEAYADLVALLASRESCFFRGFFSDGGVCTGYGDTCLTCTGFREFDYEARTASTPATPQGFVTDYCGTGTGPCGGETHCEAYPIGEAMYDFAVRDLPAAGMDVDSAWQLVERLWYSTRQGSSGSIYTCALPDSDSCAAGSWYQRLREADDDDADPSNGTPHAAELFAAFDRHNIACGLAGDPENQSTSSCPVMDTPALNVTESTSGTALTWADVPGAAEYLVLRGELGCNRQQVPVGPLPGGTTSYLDTSRDPDLQRYYRVQAIGANPVCRSAVSNCETTPEGPRLQLNDYRVVEDGVHTNGNGTMDPGETVKLPVTLFNGGTGDAFNVAGKLRTADPAQGRVLTPLASVADLPTGTQAESDAPHFELTLFDPGVACGETVLLDLEMAADGATSRAHRFEIPLGIRDRDLIHSDNVTIPRQTFTPVISTFDVVEDRPIAELDVSLNITHPNNSELIVDLASPGGTTVRLHNNTGGGSGLYTRYDLEAQPDGPGTMDDFVGESTFGAWTLSVQDTAYGTFGAASIQGFTLHVTADGAFECDVLTCAEPAPTESPESLYVNKVVDPGDGSVDVTFDWTGVAGAAGYHVLHSTAASFDSAVDLTGRTAGTTTLTVVDGDTTLPALSFFKVRATNPCNQESP